MKCLFQLRFTVSGGAEESNVRKKRHVEELQALGMLVVNEFFLVDVFTG